MSFLDGKEVSRDTLATSGVPALKVTPDRMEMPGNGHSPLCAEVETVVENGKLVPSAEFLK